MQFPNCTAKVSVLSARAKRRHIFRMFYNIVLEFKGTVYTYKHFIVHREYAFPQKNKPPKRRNASMAAPLNTFKQNEFS